MGDQTTLFTFRMYVAPPPSSEPPAHSAAVTSPLGPGQLSFWGHGTTSPILTAWSGIRGRALANGVVSSPSRTSFAMASPKVALKRGKAA